jgi:hypothetical protein
MVTIGSRASNAAGMNKSSSTAKIGTSHLPLAMPLVAGFVNRKNRIAEKAVKLIKSMSMRSLFSETVLKRSKKV